MTSGFPKAQDYSFKLLSSSVWINKVANIDFEFQLTALQTN